MSLYHRWLAGAALGCWILLTATPTVAQMQMQPGMQPRGRQQGQPGQPTGKPLEVQVVTLQGTIQALTTGAIKIAGNDGTASIVRLSPTTMVKLTGTAGPDLLKPGACVEFLADLTRHGKATDKIASLTIFTPSDQEFLGEFPEATAPGGQAPSEAKAGEGAKGAGPPTTHCTVRGRITSIKKDKLEANTGQRTVDFELAEDVKVQLRVADYRYARAGDKIACTAAQLGPGMLQATKVEIELAQSSGAPVAETGRGTPRAEAGEQHQEAEKSPAEQGDATERLVKLLTPKTPPEKEESFRIEGDPTEFHQSVLGPAPTLQRRFGKPERTTVKGILTSNGKEKTVRWQIWTWDSVKVVVDTARKARFFASDTTLPSQTEPEKTEPQTQTPLDPKSTTEKPK